MTQQEPKATRVRKLKAAGLGVGAIGAGLLLSACFGPGTIATQIGNGTAGYTGDGGKASAATLHSPQAVAVDASGNAYVADTANCVIRAYSKSTGNVATVAGNGTCGFNGEAGAAVNIELNHPVGVAIGADGNLYIADADNNRIRVEDLSIHSLNTYAGSSVGAADGDRLTTAKFNRPVGLAFDSSQNLYVADSNNDAIREIDPTSGLVSTVAGTLGVPGSSGDLGPATTAKLNDPEAIAIDKYDEIYIADAGNCRVRWIDGASTMNPLAGTTCGYSGDGGDASLAQFSHLTGLAVDPDLNVYVSDTGNNRVREIGIADTKVTTVAGTGTSGYSGNGGAGRPPSCPGRWASPSSRTTPSGSPTPATTSSASTGWHRLPPPRPPAAPRPRPRRLRRPPPSPTPDPSGESPSSDRGGHGLRPRPPLSRPGPAPLPPVTLSGGRAGGTR